MNLQGIFYTLTFKEVSDACKKHLTRDLDKDKKTLTVLNGRISHNNFCRDLRHLVELTHTIILMVSAGPFLFGSAVAICLPLFQAEKAFKACRYKLAGYVAASTTLIGLEIVAVAAIASVTFPIARIYNLTLEKVRSCLKTDLSHEEERKAYTIQKYIGPKTESVNYQWKENYLPCLLKIFALFSEGSKFADALPNELQVKILDLSMPFALKILNIACQQKASSV